MTTRRELLRALGLGAAAATVATTSAGLVPAAHAAQQRDLVEGPPPAGEGPPALTGAGAAWLLSPVRPGSAVGLGWRLDSISDVQRGAVILDLSHGDGRRAALHLCARQGRPRGLAHSELFDLVLMDGGQGDRATAEDLGRVLLGLAERVRRNELRLDGDLDALSRTLPHEERVLLYGPENLAPGSRS